MGAKELRARKCGDLEEVVEVMSVQVGDGGKMMGALLFLAVGRGGR